MEFYGRIPRQFLKRRFAGPAVFSRGPVHRRHHPKIISLINSDCNVICRLTFPRDRVTVQQHELFLHFKLTTQLRIA